jgi:peptidoglycan/LPS O-acetylase OafA/YrhL
VEEQFYLIWAPLLRCFARNVLALLLTMLALLVVVRLALQRIVSGLQVVPEPPLAWVIGIGFFDMLKLECMAQGGLAAYVVHVGAERALALLYHPTAQIGALLFVPVALFLGLNAGALDNAVWGTAYALLILNIATNPASLVRLQQPWLDALGRISYGIYVYHSFAVAGVLLLLLWLQEQAGFAASTLAFNAILYVSSIALTLVISRISYRYYESRFLQLKPRFTVVASRADAVARVRLDTQRSEPLPDIAG